MSEATVSLRRNIIVQISTNTSYCPDSKWIFLMLRKVFLFVLYFPIMITSNIFIDPTLAFDIRIDGDNIKNSVLKQPAFSK